MEQKIIRFWRFFGLFFLMVVLLSGVAAHSAPEKQIFVRIAVFQDLEELTLSIRGKFNLTDGSTGKLLEMGQNLENVVVSPLVSGIEINKKVFTSKGIKIEPKHDATILIKNRRFRGTVKIIKIPEQKLLVINEVGLEEYVRGVLYHEVSHRWPSEVLKAQAIAARTYALYRKQWTAQKDFDVTSDIYSQVYGGRNSERYRTNLAVRSTKNQIMIYDNQILPAYFHATCAGTTEDAKELWSETIPPLSGVYCEFCKKSPHFNWKRNLRSGDVQEKLNAKNYPVGLIQDISIIERNKSGRIRKIEITDRRGIKTPISGKDFREIVGPNVIKSNKYEIVMKGYYFDVIGRGWGHGVGMCQWGAYEMARQRFKFDEILKYYYPGVELVDCTKAQLKPPAKKK